MADLVLADDPVHLLVDLVLGHLLGGLLRDLAVFTGAGVKANGITGIRRRHMALRRGSRLGRLVLAPHDLVVVLDLQGVHAADDNRRHDDVNANGITGPLRSCRVDDHVLGRRLDLLGRRLGGHAVRECGCGNQQDCQKHNGPLHRHLQEKDRCFGTRVSALTVNEQRS